MLQRDPAEEALKSNNMNLDQAMSKFTNIFKCLSKVLIWRMFTKINTNALIYSQLTEINMKGYIRMNMCVCAGALLEKKMEMDKRGMAVSDYSNNMNKPVVCRPSALSKDASDRTTFLDKVRHEAQPYKVCSRQ